MNEVDRESGAGGLSELPATVVQRHMLQVALVWEGLEQYVVWDHERGLYVYQLDIRRCAATQGETLVVVKALKDGQPAIAFHSDVGMIGALFSLAKRARAGRLKYKPDERPGVLLEKVRPELEYHRARFGKTSGAG